MEAVIIGIDAAYDPSFYTAVQARTRRDRCGVVGVRVGAWGSPGGARSRTYMHPQFERIYHEQAHADLASGPLARMKKLLNPACAVVEKQGGGASLATAMAGADPTWPIRRVMTSGNASSEAERGGGAMNKARMVGRVAEWHSRGRLDLRPLPQTALQLADYAAYEKPSGGKSFRRRNSRHDDLASALLLACYGAWLWLGERGWA